MLSILRILLAVTVICIYIPWVPIMPGESLDPSWVIGINQAVAQHIPFGPGIIFTFGPFGSIYTHAFHPVTDTMMFLGSGFLGCLYGLALTLVTRRQNSIFLICIWFILASFMFMRDSLFFSYAVLIGVYCFDLVTYNKLHPRLYSPVLVFILFTGFGLYPLVKGTLFVLLLCIAILSFSLFLMYRLWKQAFAIPISILFALLSFWLGSGQEIDNLATYFIATSSIIAGYSDAMSMDGEKWEVINYAITAIFILLALYRCLGFSTKGLYLFTVFAVYLFINFKSGFVRHDAHALMCGTALVFAAWLLNSLYLTRLNLIVAIASIAVLIQINHHYIPNFYSSSLQRIPSIYINTWTGFKNRLMDYASLNQQFSAALASLNEKSQFPLLNGTSDIYPFDQAYLIASKNIWNPRPVLQSYSAYTPMLSKMDHDHLLGAKSPDNIFFKVVSIGDNRFPSSDDGLSWPILLKNYQAYEIINNFLILKRKSNTPHVVKEEKSPHKTANSSIYKLGELVTLVDDSEIKFAKITLKMTLLGKLANAIYKPSQLEIVIYLADGKEKNFRLISGISQTGIVISPLIESTNEFLLFYSKAEDLSSKRIRSFLIRAKSQAWQWQPEFEFSSKQIKMDGP
jgi:hypothetical protein